MRKKLLITLTCGIIGLNMISCNNEETLNYPNLSNNSASRTISTDDISKVSFIYNGKTYESNYFMENDSTISYMNPEVEELAKEFETMPDLYAFLYPNGIIEYFDNKTIFYTNIERIKQTIYNLPKENLLSRGDHIDGGLKPGLILGAPVSPDYHNAELVIYDDIYGLDRSEILPVEKPNLTLEIPHLKDKYNMNDKVSSMSAFSIANDALFECFEDDNYKSHCLSFFVRNGYFYNYTSTPGTGTTDMKYTGYSFGHAYFDDLHNCHVVGTKRSSWNDRITSVRISVMPPVY